MRTIDGDVAHSPFFGFEHPQPLESLVMEHGTDQLISEFAASRACCPCAHQCGRP
jgi:hypothetical protein